MLKNILLTIFLITFTGGIVYSEEHTFSVEEMIKLEDIAFVVFCEDNTSMKASKLVLSTIYNRAKSHDIDSLHKEITRKNQYSCINMKRTRIKREPDSFKKIYDMVVRFIENKQRPLTNAKYFINHNLVDVNKFSNDKLKVVMVYGAHTYLTDKL